MPRRRIRLSRSALRERATFPRSGIFVVYRLTTVPNERFTSVRHALELFPRYVDAPQQQDDKDKGEIAIYRIPDVRSRHLQLL